MPPPTVDISVVIVAWKAKRYLELCLDSLEKAPPRRSMEILVVDNASADGTAEMVETRFPKVRLIRSAENLSNLSSASMEAVRRA
ncbi:MAG TPA: glycosyltransferase [Bryobacteraceae bacterium]|nr:glycosyltransferase [Bryobacteraceae bacterium]